jgi:hypothetical protein
MAKGSIALVGSGEFLLEMSDLESLLIQEMAKFQDLFKSQLQQDKRVQIASSIGKS